jgi:hypothetical protein
MKSFFNIRPPHNKTVTEIFPATATCDLVLEHTSNRYMAEVLCRRYTDPSPSGKTMQALRLCSACSKATVLDRTNLPITGAC